MLPALRRFRDWLEAKASKWDPVAIWVGLTVIALVGIVSWWDFFSNTIQPNIDARFAVLVEVGCYVAALLAIVFSSTGARIKVLYFVTVAVTFIGFFSEIYLNASRRDPGGCFNLHASSPAVHTGKPGRMSTSDAVYFTVGTLSTAGTGSITAESAHCRELVSVQMVLGIGLLGLGLAGLTAPLRRT
jgi:hypothetical protein